MELPEIIDRFRTGSFPLIVPVILLNHCVRKYREPYLQSQVYLNLHPVVLQSHDRV